MSDSDQVFYPRLDPDNDHVFYRRSDPDLDPVFTRRSDPVLNKTRPDPPPCFRREIAYREI